jgi:hypothetical protein
LPFASHSTVKLHSETMTELHLFLHYLPPEVHSAAALGGQLAGPIPNCPIPIEFDEVMARFNRLPGGYCEPDGAWGWNTADQMTRTGGTMQAFGEQVMCVETWGQIAARDWPRLLEMFGLSSDSAVVQLVEQGVFLSADSFAEQLS